MRQKKIPLRKCTGCGEMKPKKELIRVVRAPDEKDEKRADCEKRGSQPGPYREKTWTGCVCMRESGMLKACKKGKAL